MTELDKMIHADIHLIVMIVHYGLFPLQSFFVFFVHQLNDMVMMLFEVGVQGIEPFRVGLNPHRVAIHDFRLVF